MNKSFFNAAAILSMFGLDRRVLSSLGARRDVMPPAPDFSHAASAAQHGNGGANYAPNGNARRRERRETGITARQQRLRRQREPGHPCGKIIARKLCAIGNREVRAESRVVSRFLDSCSGGPGWDRTK